MWRLLAFVALALAATWAARTGPAAPAPDALAASEEDDDAVVEPDDPGPPSTPAPRSTLPQTPAPAPDPGYDELESLAIGRVKYPRPTDDEFERSGRGVRLAHDERRGGGFDDSPAPGCTARELRGWLRLVCESFGPSIAVLGGSTEGLYVDASTSAATIVLPLVPGDRRVLQLARRGVAYWEGEGLVAEGILSESWIGTVGPHVALDAVHDEL